MSVEIAFDAVGVAEFQQAVTQFDSEMQRQIHEQLAKWAESVKTEAKRLVPVRTGYLQSTIFVRVSEWNAEVGAEAAYAANVELGTRYAKAQPFLQPAVQALLPELERVVLAAVDLAKVEAAP